MGDSAMSLAISAHDAQPAQCLGIARMRLTDDLRVTPHSHSCVEVLILLQGTLSLCLGQETVRAGAGDVIYYAPHRSHCEQIPSGQSAELFGLACSPGITAPPMPVIHDTHGRIRLLAQWIADESASGVESARDLVHTYTGALLMELRHLATYHAMDPLVLAMRAFMREHLDQSLSVSDMAGHVRMSRAHFIRQYKRLTGVTPWDELLRMRVEATRNLLITTQLPLRTIAPLVGFSDEYHLSRVFSRYQKVSPGYFRTHAGVSNHSNAGS